MATEPLIISNNEREFILRALLEDQRVDGRFLLEMRQMSLSFERFDGKASAELCLGKTRVAAVVTASVAAPFPERPTEGSVQFSVNVSPMASAANPSTGRPGALSFEAVRMLERQIRDARALDLEALCIVPGEQAWALRCDIHLLSDGGNLLDAACFAAMAALLHFRRAEVTIRGKRITVHSYADRAPVPLSIHHIPLCITFGLFSPPASTLTRMATTVAGLASVDAAATAAGSGSVPGSGKGLEEVAVLDPTDREEMVCDGSASFVLNAHRELCGVHKLGGTPLPPAMLLQCARVAADKSAEMVALLKEALAAAEAQAAERARVLHAARAGFPVPGVLDIHPCLLTGGTGDAAETAAAHDSEDEDGSDNESDMDSDEDDDSGAAAAAGGRSIASALEQSMRRFRPLASDRIPLRKGAAKGALSQEVDALQLTELDFARPVG